MKTLMIAASTLAIAWAAPAQAQQTTEAPPVPTPGVAPTTPSEVAAPAAAPAEEGIGDIIVTASRRAESLQRTAIPVTAITSDTLVQRGVTNVTEITRLVPSVKIGQLAGSGVQVTVRGIGNFGGNSFAEPGVPFNLDGVYVARNAGASGIFYDVNRVELLKGPQGTLYGRNSTGGVVNILTNDPTSEFGGRFVGEYGNPRRVRAEAAVNVPVADWLAIRVAGQRTYSDGFTSDGGGKEDNYAGRIKAKLTPTPDLTILLEADYAKLKDGVQVGGFLIPGYNPFKDITCGPTSLQNSVIPKFPTGAPFPPTLQVLPLIKCDAFNDNRSRGLQGTIDYDLGPVRTTLIVANRTNTFHYRHYGAGFPVLDDNRGDPSEYTTAELRLASDTHGPFKWVVGGFYFDDDLHTTLTFDQGVSFQRPDIHVHTKSYSGFAEGTYSLTDSFRLTLGGRYTSDRKRIDGIATGPNGLPYAARGGFPSAAAAAAACPTSVPGVTYNPATAFGPETNNPYFGGSCTTPIAGRKTFDKFTYKAGVEYDVSPSSLLYGTVSTGFKSGGFYASLDTTNIPGIPANQVQGNSYKPETLMAYTIGSKNRFFDDTLQLNVEAYYWKYRNKQYSHLGVIQPGNGNNLVVDNAGRAEIYGSEVDLIWRPSKADVFSANVQYSHSEYTKFVYTAFFTSARPNLTCAVGPITAAGRFNTAVIDCSGKPVSFAPKWNLNFSYYHTFDLGSSGTLSAGASTQVQSHYFVGEEYLSDERQKSVSLSNAELTWRSEDGHVGLTAFVKNIENSKVLTSSFVYTFNGRVRQGLLFPRTYGGRLEFRF